MTVTVGQRGTSVFDWRRDASLIMQCRQRRVPIEQLDSSCRFTPWPPWPVRRPCKRAQLLLTPHLQSKSSRSIHLIGNALWLISIPLTLHSSELIIRTFNTHLTLSISSTLPYDRYQFNLFLVNLQIDSVSSTISQFIWCNWLREHCPSFIGFTPLNLVDWSIVLIFCRCGLIILTSS